MLGLMGLDEHSQNVERRALEEGLSPQEFTDQMEGVFRSAWKAVNVRFDDFMADDIAMVRRIYELADQPFDDTVEAHMAAFMADHPRGKHGRIAYDLALFDVDPAERTEALAFYRDRFL